MKIWNPSPICCWRATRAIPPGREGGKQTSATNCDGVEVNDKVPLFAVVNRLTNQKGSGSGAGGVTGAAGAGRAVGATSARAIRCFRRVPRSGGGTPGQVGVQIGYHEAFSHRIMGGADVILVRGRFEPCGLTQLYGLSMARCLWLRGGNTGGWPIRSPTVQLENLADGIASSFCLRRQ